MPHDLQLIGRIIKEERKYRKLSQIDLSKKFNLNQCTISRLEKGANLTEELYDRVLRPFGMILNNHPPVLLRLLNEFYIAMEFIHSVQIELLYKELENYTFLSYNDYYIKQLIYGLYVLYTNKLDQFYAFINYIIPFDFVYEGDLQRYYNFLLGYYHHLKQDYVKADEFFIKIAKCNYEHKIMDDIFAYIFSWNNILLNKFRSAALYLDKSRKSVVLKNNEIGRLHIDRLLSYIYFFDSNYEDCIRYAEKFIMKKDEIYANPETIKITELYYTASLILLKRYREAGKCLENLILYKDDRYLSLYYVYLLICLKITNDPKWETYFNLLTQEPFYEKLKANMLPLINWDVALINDSIFEQGQLLSHQKNHLNYIHVKLLFHFMKEHLWKKRKYAVYKKFNDIIIRKYSGSLHHEI